MVARNYLSALALSSLLGCSVSPDDSGYVESPPASVAEERVMNYAMSSLTERSQQKINPFFGKRVSLLYATNDGPIAGSEGYTGGRPINSALLDIARSELRDRNAYVSEQAVFGGSYENRINISRMPNMDSADLVVIADDAFKLTQDLQNVYVIKKDGNKYKLEEAGK